MVKAIAALGLGCYIYAGEDMPMESPTAMVQAPNIKTDMKQPTKIASTLGDEEKIALAPTLEKLRELYVVMGPAAKKYNAQFTKRKEELAANG
jgi:hypothetical protein